jgi:hypothetical protein
MARMIDLIRQSAVPANVMRSASKGALSLPPEEMLEILVLLTGNPLFAEQATMTLAGWDERTSLLVAADPQAPKEVLEYFIDPKNLRPRLLPALLENPAIPEARLEELAKSPLRDAIEALLRCLRVHESAALLRVLLANPALTPSELQVAQGALDVLESSHLEMLAPVEESPVPEPPLEAPPLEAVAADAEEKTQYEIEHAAEIAAEEDKPFELIGGLEDPEGLPVAGVVLPDGADAPAITDTQKIKVEVAQQERISIIQKIARLTVGQRVQLAMKGNREERSLLIRDGSKLVASAVLVSPKLTDSEVEMFSSMKNVQEQVLRDIARSPKFKKLYPVTRNLVNNPRCPLDLSLTLLGHLMVNDLRAVSVNKNVPETLRKLATKRYKEKGSTSK